MNRSIRKKVRPSPVKNMTGLRPGPKINFSILRRRGSILNPHTFARTVNFQLFCSGSLTPHACLCSTKFRQYFSSFFGYGHLKPAPGTSSQAFPGKPAIKEAVENVDFLTCEEYRKKCFLLTRLFFKAPGTASLGLTLQPCIFEYLN